MSLNTTELMNWLKYMLLNTILLRHCVYTLARNSIFAAYCIETEGVTQSLTSNLLQVFHELQLHQAFTVGRTDTPQHLSHR